jgi:hypothetical protein
MIPKTEFKKFNKDKQKEFIDRLFHGLKYG